jgi:hypothetical protein
MSSVYELEAPTEWAAPPDRWSGSSLDEVDACPRRWQLLRSRWGAHERFPVRTHPAGVEGWIVHDALDRLARACGQRGNPAFGTDAFREAAVEADFFGGFARAVSEAHEQADRHPRPGSPFRIRTPAQELANRAVRLFRAQYRPGTGVRRAATPSVGSGQGDLMGLLRARGALSEVKLRHPTLPMTGTPDRIQLTGDGIEVVDYKSGRACETHRTQLERYALLWWRVTGEMPTGVIAQYLGEAQRWEVEEATLLAAEVAASEAIGTAVDRLRGRPAPARRGPACTSCPVRARCDEGWALGEDTARAEGRGDAQLTVTGRPGPHGFLARDRAGGEVAVVHEAAVAALLPPLGDGHIIRVIDGVRKRRVTNPALELRPWTEVYLLAKGTSSVRRP